MPWVFPPILTISRAPGQLTLGGAVLVCLSALTQAPWRSGVHVDLSSGLFCLTVRICGGRARVTFPPCIKSEGNASFSPEQPRNDDGGGGWHQNPSQRWY